jgi:hypothetical protein
MHKQILTLWCLIAAILFSFHADAGEYKEVIDTGSWNNHQLDTLLARASRISNASERIEFLSGQLSGVPYKAGTLIGDQHTREALVINLAGVDCFTFIDYVEAMRRSGSYAEFKENLRKVRYRNGVVDYSHRNHFFSDWISCNTGFLDDVTHQVSAGKSKTATKKLNAAENGKQLLPGIAPRNRKVCYIPAEAMDNVLQARLRTGDYLGIYSTREDLDVSHVGIVIRGETGVIFRQASSQEKYRRVIDTDLKAYLSDKPGIVILRPTPDKPE